VLGRAINRKRAERPGELELVTDLALEQVSNALAPRNLVEADLDGVGLLGTGSDGVRAHARLMLKRKRDRDELAGDESQLSAADDPKK
jgi:hypothetical protein